MKKAALLFLLAAGALAAGTASAHGHARVHFGVFVGGPVWGPWYYPPPYYYYPPPVYVAAPPAPQVYVERQDAAPAAQPAQDWWYYCEQSRGYYPYVKSCPSGWQRVPPAPPPG